MSGTQSFFKHRQAVENELKEDLKRINDIDEEQAEEKLNLLLRWLQETPELTTFRVNTLLIDSEKILEMLKNSRNKSVQLSLISVTSELPDLIIVGSKRPHSELEIIHHQEEAVVDASCGTAVLRGSHVFAPGIMGLTGGRIGEEISIFSDITGQCKKGSIKPYENGSRKFLGYGILRQTRDMIFQNGGSGTGIAIQVTETVSGLPQLSDDDLPRGLALLQNLPSIICSRILDPEQGETVLDMCAAPGNKTTHLSALMKNRGILIALEKIKSKITKLEKNCEMFGSTNVKVFCFDSTKAVQTDPIELKENKNFQAGPPFQKESFDKILLDGPCSVLGKRPQLFNKITVKELRSHVPQQRKLMAAAVELLKDGGTLVYSTCTITIAENEGIVAWALKTFPYLKLTSAKEKYDSFALQDFPVSSGYPIDGLSFEMSKNLLRFGPESNTVGFFIAMFRKIKK